MPQSYHVDVNSLQDVIVSTSICGTMLSCQRQFVEQRYCGTIGRIILGSSSVCVCNRDCAYNCKAMYCQESTGSVVDSLVIRNVDGFYRIKKIPSSPKTSFERN